MNNQRQSVLVIDDDPVIFELLDALFDNSVNIISASNAKEGMDLAIAEAPDLILLDVRMPEMDRYET